MKIKFSQFQKSSKLISKPFNSKNFEATENKMRIKSEGCFSHLLSTSMEK